MSLQDLLLRGLTTLTPETVGNTLLLRDEERILICAVIEKDPLANRKHLPFLTKMAHDNLISKHLEDTLQREMHHIGINLAHDGWECIAAHPRPDGFFKVVWAKGGELIALNVYQTRSVINQKTNLSLKEY